jgi:hypothetical protein
MTPTLAQSLADAVLALHAGVVSFIVGGALLIWIGNARQWWWVNAIGFRLAHGVAIAYVVAQSWFGITCPLTTLESWLRVQAGGAAYERSFIEDWLHALIFFQAPPWVFVLVYTTFGAFVAFTWWRFPPNRKTDATKKNRPRMGGD